MKLDLAELEEDRRRNERDRREMLDRYAARLEAEGVVQRAAQPPRARRVKKSPD